ncbi:MAG: PAS domain S-box protein [Deltaproteobacteria bacterium]|nr:PAS domain S-box protein [Deltaproteobacteria bacterium]
MRVIDRACAIAWRCARRDSTRAGGVGSCECCAIQGENDALAVAWSRCWRRACVMRARRCVRPWRIAAEKGPRTPARRSPGTRSAPSARGNFERVLVSSEAMDAERLGPPDIEPALLGPAILAAAGAARLGVAITEWNGEHLRHLWVNDVAVQILGRSRDELLRGSPLDVLPEDERDRLAEPHARRARGEPVPPSFATTILRPDGRRVPIEVSICELEHAGKRLSVGFFVDLSDRERSVAALKASEARFRNLIEGAPDGVVISRDGTILYANGAAARMLGHDAPSTLVGDSLARYLEPADVQVMRARIMETIRTRRPLPPREYRARRRDGTTVVAEITSLPIEFEGGPAIVALVRDVTERAALHAQLARADRLASLGTLSAGVAHEINNPLAFVSLGIEALIHALADAPLAPSKRSAVANLIDDIRKGTDRVAAIVRDLRVFAHFGDDTPGSVDLPNVLAAAARMAAHEIKPRARLSRDVGPLPRVRGNAQLLEQVFVNLLVNAAQAMPERKPDGEIAIHAAADGADHVAVEVRDNGPGIPPEIVSRVFDPFFTTKPPGVGTGLGLAVCHGIVAQFGGSIALESRLGEGTTVRVRLLVSDGVATRPPDRSEPERGEVRARIFLIDDEPAIARGLRMALGRRHDVTVTCDPAEALEVLLGGATFDVILCDLTMPGITGADIHERLAASRPEVLDRMVFMTGGAFTPRLRAFLEAVPNRTLEKPFSVASLEEIVRELAARGMATRGK